MSLLRRYDINLYFVCQYYGHYLRKQGSDQIYVQKKLKPTMLAVKIELP